MVKTHGLTHLSLKVPDPDRSMKFYTEVFGVQEYYRDAEEVQARGPGPYDVLAFEKSGQGTAERGGITHFGFRLTSPADIDLAVAEVERAGGRVIRRGEFAPGQPYAFVADPDGYEFEIWFEPERG